MAKLRRSLQEAPVVRMGDYDYFVHPITDGIPQMDPGLLEEVLDEMLRVGDFRCDLIIAPEAMGIPLAVGLSLRTGISYNVVRKKRYSLKGEASVSQLTGYSQCQMYINGVSPGKRVVIVDDVISTGGMLKAVVGAFRELGAEVVDIIVVVEKGGNRKKLEEELGMKIKTLIKVEVRDGRVVVVS